VRIELVGLGYWGSKLLRNLVTLVGVDNIVAVDVDPRLRAQASMQYPGLQTLERHADALADDDVVATLIATPVASHATLAMQSIEAGRHVFVEKPLAASVQGAQQLVEAAQSRDLVLMSGHTFLFSPAIEWIANFLQDGRAGRVHYITSSRLNLGLFRDDVNVIWDLGAHDFSILCQLLGEFPTSVQTSARTSICPGIPDVAFVNLVFPSGVIASVNLSWLAPRKTRSTVIVADSKMVVFDDASADEPVKVYDRGVFVEDSPAYTDNRLTYRYGDTVAPVIGASEPLALEISHFLDCVRSGVPCRSDGEFGLRIVELLAAADASWRQGGAPVLVMSQQRTSVELNAVVDLVAATAPAGSYEPQDDEERLGLLVDL
jgi:predicted dehydrogenase